METCERSADSATAVAPTCRFRLLY